MTYLRVDDCFTDDDVHDLMAMISRGIILHHATLAKLERTILHRIREREVLRERLLSGDASLLGDVQ